MEALTQWIRRDCFGRVWRDRLEDILEEIQYRDTDFVNPENVGR